MKKLMVIALLGLVFVTQAQAAKGRKPCSGAKGGVSHCTGDGKFVCNDGSVSQSKKYCR